MVDRFEARRLAHRRRVMAAAVGENIRKAAIGKQLDAASLGVQIPHHDAVMSVFADQDLLGRCHKAVKGMRISAPPRSSVDAQNG